MKNITDIRIGDVLTRPKALGVPVPFHVGVVVGPNLVLQNTPEKGEHFATVQEFSAGKPITVHRTGLNPSIVIARAKDILSNPQKYDLFQNNCEHTATKVVHGIAKSSQLAILAVIAILGGVALCFALKRR